MKARAKFHYILSAPGLEAIAVANNCTQLPVRRDNFHRRNFRWHSLFHHYLKRTRLSPLQYAR